MSLSSTSTIDDALAQYKDNLDWEASVTKAREALAAIRFILACRPQVMAKGDRTLNFESMAAEKTSIEAYLQTFDTSRQPTASFTSGRALCD
jgi:hypothetical protein